MLCNFVGWQNFRVVKALVSDPSQIHLAKYHSSVVNQTFEKGVRSYFQIPRNPAYSQFGVRAYSTFFPSPPNHLCTRENLLWESHCVNLPNRQQSGMISKHFGRFERVNLAKFWAYFVEFYMFWQKIMANEKILPNNYRFHNFF